MRERIEVEHLRADLGNQPFGLDDRDRSDGALAGFESGGEFGGILAERGDDAEPGDDDTVNVRLLMRSDGSRR
jgi:hypothetical protein